jgi:pSer/pThr/pTyr-binding forkhead associated (FHA) protein
MKIYCENCMGENEIDEELIKESGYRAACNTCGHMIFIDSEAVDALLLRKNPIPTVVKNPALEEDYTEELNSVSQSNTTTTIAAKIDLPKMETSAATLAVLDGPDIGLEFTMDIPRIVIGRRGADINLNDRLVSRRHVSIEASGGRYLLKDLGSTNGTFLNGSPVSMEFLKHGDEIQIGSTLVRFRMKSMESDVVVLDE